MNGVIGIIAFNFSKRYVLVTDNHYYIKALVSIIVVLFLFAINNYFFMRAIFGKDND